LAINPLTRNRPIVDEQLRPLQNLQVFSEQVAALAFLTGSGSPEGVVSARQLRQYMDTATGQTYIKRVDDVGGDTTLGWV
jgi:hypothetical protein